MFSGKVCQYIELKCADPIRAGKKNITVHFSNACILQSMRSNFLNFFESYLVVVNLKILWLKIVKNVSISVTTLHLRVAILECFWCKTVKEI